MRFKNNESIKLLIPAPVMGQINCIVDHFKTEVSWFGDIAMVPAQGKEPMTIAIKNVYLFPQVVTQGSFYTDRPQISDLYDEWYESKLNEIADIYDKTGESVAIMQYNGHSHVNAACVASPEDKKFRNSREGMNLYSIHNKAGKTHWEFWLDDVIYEDADIDIVYTDDIFENVDWVQEPEPPVVAQNCGYYSRGKYSNAPKAGQTTGKKTNDTTTTTKGSEDIAIEVVSQLTKEQLEELNDQYEIWQQALDNIDGKAYGQGVEDWNGYNYDGYAGRGM